MFNPKNERGQTLILMLIVTVVSLTIGVAISSRAVSTLKQTSYTAQAGKAQKFADAGAEEALGTTDLSSLATSCPPATPCQRDVDGDTVNDTSYYVEQLGGGTTVEAILEKDETVQIDLTGYGSGQNVNIYWVSGADEEANKAALVLTFIYESGSGTNAAKHAYDPNATRRTTNNFSAPGLGATINGTTYNYGQTIATPAGTNKALRIRPLYNDVKNSFVIQATGANNFPNQGYTITSTGTYGEAEWTAEVTKMNPALPSIFDYAIFSATDLTK